MRVSLLLSTRKVVSRKGAYSSIKEIWVRGTFHNAPDLKCCRKNVLSQRHVNGMKRRHESGKCR